MQTGEKLHVHHDRFAVAAVVKNVIIVSHSLQKISAVSALLKISHYYFC